MLFSVLIANYNNSQYLDTAIASVMNQTYTNWEIILVDDASTDSFDRVIQPYKIEPRIKIFRNVKNYGCGFTKRKCAEKAGGEIMAFLDPDDALERDALQVMQEAHATYPHCSLIHSTHFICDASLHPKRIADYPRALPAGTPYLLLSDGSVHAFASFKKSNYKKTQGLSPMNKKAVDQDLYYKLEEAGDFQFIDKALYYYRIHENSISTMGKESEATLWHYRVILKACQRRMQNSLKNDPEEKYWYKKYRTRYYKVNILYNFRRKNWFGFLYNIMVFPFVGGWENIVSYARKLPKERMNLVRRSLVDNHEIKA